LGVNTHFRGGGREGRWGGEKSWEGVGKWRDKWKGRGRKGEGWGG